MHLSECTSGCHELPDDFSGKIQSLKAFNNCMRVFSEEECTGNQKELEGLHAELQEWIDKIKSWEMCSTPKRAVFPIPLNKVKATATQEEMSPHPHKNCEETHITCSSSGKVPAPPNLLLYTLVHLQFCCTFLQYSSWT